MAHLVIRQTEDIARAIAAAESELPEWRPLSNPWLERIHQQAKRNAGRVPKVESDWDRDLQVEPYAFRAEVEEFGALRPSGFVTN